MKCWKVQWHPRFSSNMFSPRMFWYVKESVLPSTCCRSPAPEHHRATTMLHCRHAARPYAQNVPLNRILIVVLFVRYWAYWCWLFLCFWFRSGVHFRMQAWNCFVCPFFVSTETSVPVACRLASGLFSISSLTWCNYSGLSSEWRKWK